jgi:hypothetical protein
VARARGYRCIDVGCRACVLVSQVQFSHQGTDLPVSGRAPVDVPEQIVLRRQMIAKGHELDTEASTHGVQLAVRAPHVEVLPFWRESEQLRLSSAGELDAIGNPDHDKPCPWVTLG